MPNEPLKTKDEILLYHYHSFIGTRYSCADWPADISDDMKEMIFACMDDYRPQFVSPASGEGEGWTHVKDGLPDYDDQVLWMAEDGVAFTEALDKDGNEWLRKQKENGARILWWQKITFPDELNQPAPEAAHSPAGDQ